MNKKLVWFAAATLALGFASCSNEKEDDTVTEIFSVKVEADALTNDLRDVYEAYYSAAGIAIDADTMCVGIAGKDSADCAKKFLALMDKAEKQFASKTQWEEEVSVIAQNSKLTEVYRKVFGANSTNSEYYADTFGGLLEDADAIVPKRGVYTKDLFVDTWGEYILFNSTAQYYAKRYPASRDLNEHAGGRYVYMSAELTENYHDAITGAFILKSTTGVCKKEIMYNGIKYQCSSELDNVAIPNYRNRDLNEEAGGPWLFLYTTHDISTGKRLLSGTYVCRKFDIVTGSESTTLDEILKKCHIEVVGDELEFMPGSYAVSTEADLNNIKLEHRDGPDGIDLTRGQDMNEGAGGRYMYLLLQWEKDPE